MVEQDILFIEEELPHELCIFNEDKFDPFHAYTNYIGYVQQEVRNKGLRYWSRYFTDKELRIVFVNDKDNSRKMLNRELCREEFMYLLELFKAGLTFEEVFKKLNVTYEVGEFY
jgi:hypothetical protein